MSARALRAAALVARRDGVRSDCRRAAHAADLVAERRGRDPEPEESGTPRCPGPGRGARARHPETCADRGPLPHQTRAGPRVLPPSPRTIRRRPGALLRPSNGRGARGSPGPGWRRAGDRGLNPPLRRRSSDLRRRRLHGADRALSDPIVPSDSTLLRAACSARARDLSGVSCAPRSAREDPLPSDESCVCGMSDPIPLRLRPSTKAIRTTASSGRAMVRAITFDAFGTLIDTGRDVLIRIARSVCDDQRPSLDAEALLATWDRHFFAAETAPFLTLAEITEDSLEKTFREYGIEATPAPYVDRLVALWRQAKAYAEVPRILDALDGVPRAVVSNADHEFLLDILERNGLRFDAVLHSESAQTYKPRPRIFEGALQCPRLRPNHVVP